MISKSRKIIERIIVEGDLVLLTPTSLGNGDNDGLTDMSLLLDEVDRNALLTGTSIAGALRNYLQEVNEGFEVAENKDSFTRQLFGFHEDDYKQSYLVIDDALSSEKPKTELRDGVRIEGNTRTAKDGAKFDLELLEAGTTFKLRFELLICEQEDGEKTLEFREELVSAFVTALQGFEKGEIYIGARKRRGYGECKVENWKIQKFDLTNKTGLLDWLRHDTNCLTVTTQTSIVTALGSSQITDNRAYFELNADFALDGSILIRSGSKLPNVSDKGQPDTVHLRSRKVEKDSNGKLVRDGQGKLKIVDLPTNSGTSLAGVLRHRSVKICNTLKDGSGEAFVEKFFGVDMEELKKHNKANNTNETPFSSRLEVKETEINTRQTNDLVQTRVKIDRFTGGAMDTALFDAAPVFSDGNEKAVRISLRLRNPNEAEIGLLLLLLKDLWTSDLAIGGESSIGRGRLKGKTACLNYKNGSGTWHSNLERIDENKVKIDGVENNSEKIDLLNKFVKSFNENINP